MDLSWVNLKLSHHFDLTPNPSPKERGATALQFDRILF